MMVVATVSMSWSGSSTANVGIVDVAPVHSHLHSDAVAAAAAKKAELAANPLIDCEDHHRCRRSHGRITLLPSQAAVVTSNTPSDSADNSSTHLHFTMDEATAALNSLMIDPSIRPFVSSSPTKPRRIINDETSSKSTTMSITNEELDLLTEWDLLSPPNDEPESPTDEGVVLNSSVPCSEHQITSSSCSSANSSTPLSVSTASYTSHVMSADAFNSASKKRVRFADAHGKPLAVVCTFANSPVGSYDSANNTPVATTLSRIFNLVQAPNGQQHLNGGGCAMSSDADCMEVLFPDPLTSYSALTEKLRTQNIALESVCCRSGYIRGMIRVRNLSYIKNIFARITFDGWASSNDWSAEYFPIIMPTDGRAEFDLFQFSVPIPPHLMPGTIVDFCVCYRCGDRSGEYWDNNGGRNYSLRYRPLSNMYSLAASMRRNPVTTTTSTASSNMSNPSSILSNGYNSSSSSIYTRNAAEMEAERARRIREFVWSEFASWNGGSALIANRTAVSSAAASGMRVASVVTTVSTTTTAPAGKDVPYW